MKNVLMYALALAAIVSFVGTGCSKSSTAGADGRKLTLVKPTDQTIDQGETDEVAIMIDRDKFNDPVEIKVRDLPAGVQVATGSKASILASDKSVNITLVAAPDAKPVSDHRVAVVASAPGLPDVTEYFKLTVKQK
jgi:hypothetical protein